MPNQERAREDEEVALLEEQPISEEENLKMLVKADSPSKSKASSIGDMYESSFVHVITICNFAQGFKRLMDLGLYFVFKEKLHLEPGEIEMLLGIINLPWVIKMIFGILSDNYTLFGSRRKSYVIVASLTNVVTLGLMMAFSIRFGKVFITTCVFITQLCMTYCDAITDALVVQASRFDEEMGSENLNSLTQLATAAGGILGCGFAAFIEIWEGLGASGDKQQIDANLYFAIYSVFIVMLLVSAIRLNSDLEPEVIMKQRQTKQQGLPIDDEQSLSQNCASTFVTVVEAMKHPEIHLSLLYFLLQGIFVPNLDDLHYIFLTDRCGMKKFMYDILNVLTYIGVVLLTLVYNKFLTRVEMRTLITLQLFIFLFVTLLQLANSLRLNPVTALGFVDAPLFFGGGKASDILINSVTFFFGTQSVLCLAQLPMIVQLTRVIPQNVEAAMTAFVTGTFVFCYEVGCKMSGSFLCSVFNVDNSNLDRYWVALAAKVPCILLTLFFVSIVPTNAQISGLVAKMKAEQQATATQEGRRSRANSSTSHQSLQQEEASNTQSQVSLASQPNM